MEANKAIELLHELIAAECEVVKTNGMRGLVSAEKRERKIVMELFQHLTGERITLDQLDSIVEY